MRSPTLGLLLVSWCVLALAPALLISVFVGVDTTNPSAGVLVIWLVGYLAQIAVFLIVTTKTSGGLLGWLIAALVPWLANWAAPISPWWLVMSGAIVAGYAVWLYRSAAMSRPAG